MGLAFAEVDTESVVAVLALVVAADWGSTSDNLAAVLAAELGLPSSRSNNRHY